MIGNINIMMLLTDGFGGFGGIAKFNSDFLQALDASEHVGRVHALPRIIVERIETPVPESVVYVRKAARGKFQFVRALAGEVWRGNRPDLVICGHLNLLEVAWMVARLNNARLALVIHGIEAWSPRRSRLLDRLPRSVDTLIAVSSLSANRFSAWSKVPMDRAFILPNSVDLGRFVGQQPDAALLARYGLGSSRVILTVGRLASQERYKGFDEIIELMPRLIQRFPTLKYLIVGDGPDRERLQAKAKNIGVANQVVFTGRIPEREKVAHYNLADAYVMPSFGEGFGIVLIEAAACGLPIVGSRADGSQEALLGGRLGTLVDPHDAEELLEAVTAALNSDSRGKRNELVETFSEAKFHERVAEWIGTQVAAIKATKNMRLGGAEAAPAIGGASTVGRVDSL